MPRLFIDVEGRFAQFESALNRVEQRTTQVARNVESAFGNLKGQLAAAAATIGGAVAFKGLVDAGEHINALSIRTGIAVEDLAALKYAAEQLDVPFENVVTSLARLNKAIVSAGAGDVQLQKLFEALKLPNEAKGIGEAKDTLLKIADIFPRLTQAQKDFVGKKFFGKTGEELNNLFAGGRAGLERLLEQGKLINPMTKQFAQASDELNDNLKRIAAQGQNTATVLLGPVVKGLAEVTDAFANARQESGLFSGLEAGSEKFIELVRQADLLPRIFAASAAAFAGIKIAGVAADIEGAAVKAVTSTQQVVAAKLAEAAAEKEAAATKLAVKQVAESYAKAELVAAEAAAASAVGMQRLALTQAQVVPARQALRAAALETAAAEAAYAAATSKSAAAGGIAMSLIRGLGGLLPTIITLLTVGAAAWILFGDKAKEAGGKAAKAADDSIEATKRAVKALQDQGASAQTGRQNEGLIRDNQAQIEALDKEIADVRAKGAERVKAIEESNARAAAAARRTGRPALPASVTQNAVDEVNAQTAAEVKALDDRRIKLGAETAALLKQEELAKARAKQGEFNLTDLMGGDAKNFKATDRIRILEQQLDEVKQAFQDSLQGIDRAAEDTGNFEQALSQRQDAIKEFRDRSLEILAQINKVNEARPIQGRDSAQRAQSLEEQEKQRQEVIKRTQQVTREANEESAKSFFSNQQAVKEYDKSLRELSAQVLDLRGQTREAVLLRFDIQTADLKKKLELIAATTKDAARKAQAETGLSDLTQARDLSGFNAEAQKLQEKAGLIRDQLANEESRIDIARKSGAISEIESLQQVSDARRNSVAQLKDLSASYEDVARSSGDERLLQNARNFRAELDRLASQADLLRDKFQTAFEEGVGGTLDKLMNGQIRSFKDLLRSLGDGLAQAINKIASNSITTQLFGKEGIFKDIPTKLAEIFGGAPKAAAKGAVAAGADIASEANDAAAVAAKQAGSAAQAAEAQASTAALATSLTTAGAEVTAFATELVTQQALVSAALTELSGGATASAAAEQAASSIAVGAMTELTAAATVAAAALQATAAAGAAKGAAGAAAAIAGAHTGGVAGGGEPMARIVDLSAFRAARRFHTGGIAGDEVPIIAKKGEGIFTPAQMSKLAPVESVRGGALEVKNYFAISQPADKRTQAQIAHQAGIGMNRALKRNG